MYFLAALLLATTALATPKVAFEQDRLLVDGKPQPQLYGVELQYFRLRAGYGPNMPREKVLELWNRALDRVVEAKMNTISFYIPWDFHEYKEGHFDFTGTVDEDGDGNPDYPSRDILTFFRLAQEHGIKRIMVRPGPYINAEWGFLGFGAIPSWFHDKYPDSHMKSPQGGKRALYDYLDPELLRHTKLWFTALYREVLKDKMGPGKPIVFVQLDNETNYQWQGIFSGDYAPRTLARYRTFLQSKFKNLAALNKAHSRQWKSWSEVQPPQVAGQNLAEDQAWYRYSDYVLFQFLSRVRKIWEEVGVKEPGVLFTLAESYNAPWQGLLPNYVYRNFPGRTGLMTVNLYPKTYHSEAQELLNSPFKADLDVKAADAANDFYLKSQQEWVLGPEIQGGWWRGTPVSDSARLQTYLTVLGHGMKALFVYYFHEGQNWGVHWVADRVQSLYQNLRQERRLAPDEKPNEEFWQTLQARTDKEVVMGHNARWLAENPRTGQEDLFFDAPLDGNAEPRGHFSVLKLVGERLVAPYQDFLGRSQELTDSVVLVKDTRSHEPSALLDAARAKSDWDGGLLGWLLTTGLNPKVYHPEINPELRQEKLFFHIDTGHIAPQTARALARALGRGQSVVNFMTESLPCHAKLFSSRKEACVGAGVARAIPGMDRADVRVTASGKMISAEGPFFAYRLPKGCQAILQSGEMILGYQCKLASGATFTQIGVPLFSPYNSGNYGAMADGSVRSEVLRSLTKMVSSHLQLSPEADRVSVFARKDPKRKLLWITLKTGAKTDQSFRLKLGSKLYFSGASLLVTEPLAQTETKVSLASAVSEGIPLSLKGEEAKVVVLRSE